MKINTLAVLTAALCLLCSCQPATVTPQSDNSSSVASEHSNQAESSEVPEVPEILEIGVGDTIEAEGFCEFAVNGVTFTYDVLPEHIDTFYTHYVADEGKIYLDIDVSVKNLDKKTLACDEVAEIVLDYNDGYTYRAFPVVEDSTTGFTYANISFIDPLETMEMRFLVDCPLEVYEDTAPLLLTIEIGDETWALPIREDGQFVDSSMQGVS